MTSKRGASSARGVSKKAGGAPRHSRETEVVSVREVSEGDVSPATTPQGIERLHVEEVVSARRTAIETAVKDILARGTPSAPSVRSGLEAIITGSSPDDAEFLRRVLMKVERKIVADTGINPDEELADDWREGGYPYKHLMLRKNYE